MTQTAARMPEPTIVNGVNVTALGDTIAAVQKDIGLAEFKFRCTNRWLEGGHNRSTIGAFYGCRAEDTTRDEPFVMDADEPPVLLGHDAGANPVEYVLHALAACLTTTMVYHAAARGLAIELVESSLEGDLDLRGFLGLSDEVRRGYREVRVRMRVKSQADADVLRDLAKFSPVYEMISRSLPVDVQVATH